MKNSAMLHAFQVIRKKPMLLLLLLPVQLLSAFTLKFMPDISGMLDIENMMVSMDTIMPSLMSGYMVLMLVSSVISMISFAALFLLTPPSMELMLDGAGGLDTQPGWYIRGLRRHWWKPVVDSLVLGVITGIVFIAIYIIIVILSFILIPILTAMLTNNNSPANLEGAVNQIMLGSMGIGLIFGLIISLPLAFTEAMFAIFLPALADRGFGESFKLVFSKKGFRQVPRVFGGYLLISFVSTAIMAAFGIAYVLLTGVGEGPLGPVMAMLRFISSWPGVLSAMLATLPVVLKTVFRFCVYQRIKDREAQEALLPNQ